MKTQRITVVITKEKKAEIERWADVEDLTTSAYLVTLHNGHVAHAHEHGLPLPAGDYE